MLNLFRIFPKYGSYKGDLSLYIQQIIFYRWRSEISLLNVRASSNQATTRFFNILNADFAPTNSSKFSSISALPINELASLSTFFNSSDSAIVFN